MRVFVLGGTGAIGGPTVQALIAAGHEVTALARSDAKAEDLRRAWAMPVAASLFDADALARAFEGHDAVINLATALPNGVGFVLHRGWRENNRVRADGSAAATAAARRAGISRFVQESVAMLYPDRADEWIDESVAVAPEIFSSRGNLVAERNVEAFGGVVLRFGLFVGPTATSAEQLLGLARRRIAPVLGHPDGYVSSIHLDDGAQAVVAALDAPAGVYNVVDDEPMTKRAYADAIADAVGKRAWVRAPGRAGVLLGDRLAGLVRSRRVSNERFRTTTGWAPQHRSAHAAWRATAKALGVTGEA
ncbi:MAG: NAD-dependent epimerase/dehydratase family protein [Microthrixaceae bacterium]